MLRLEVENRLSPERYTSTLARQEECQRELIESPELPDRLILVEHEEVYTVGRTVEIPAENRPVNRSTGREVEWIEIGRGGKATFHGPGQLIAYPIFSLERHGRDVHRFIRKLEQVCMLALRPFGVSGVTREGLTGLWVKNRFGEWKKIASIGIGVRKWVTYHGLGLNISTDLSYFKAISPCDQEGEIMTSLAEVLAEKGQVEPEMSAVKQALIEAFKQIFSFDEVVAESEEATSKNSRPSWLRVKAPGSPEFSETDGIVRKLGLVTVCEEARCPNIGECWTHHTATFMIMGDLCTRRCSFCAVKDGTLDELKPLDSLEPYKVGKAVSELGLKHVVITSVNRDDLPDMGADHFDRTVRAIRAQNPDCNIELLIPDMRGRRELLEVILRSPFVSVLNHNVETVPALYRTVRPGADFRRSLNILRWAKEISPHTQSKSGIMVGLGESYDDVLGVMDALRSVDVDILTIGQYLRPSDKQLPIARYIHPDEFARYKDEALSRGFRYVESGPLVRSSYHAWQHTGDLSEPYSAAAPLAPAALSL